MTANEILRAVRGRACERLDVTTRSGDTVAGVLHSWSRSSLWLLVADEDRLIRHDDISALRFAS